MIPSSMYRYLRVESTAWSSAREINAMCGVKLPLEEWTKRLVRMAQDVAVASCLSVDECLDHIVDGLYRPYHLEPTEVERAWSEMQFELRRLGYLEPPLKPRPRRFRGQHLPRWPYGGRW